MDLRSLNIFIQVAELNSFTGAGEKLGYSQPTISFQIKQLEQELNVKLFDRIGHTISLTDEGKQVLAYAQQICNMSQEMILEAGKEHEPEGTVRLAMADSLCNPLIANRFAAFRKAYPKVALHITTASTEDLLKLLDHNEVDILCTLDSPIYSTTYVRAAEESIGVHYVVSKENPLVDKEHILIEDLLKEPFLSTEHGVSYNRILEEELAKKGLELKPILEMGSADLLCQLVADNMGTAFLPDYVTEAAVQTGKIKRLQVEDLHIEVKKQVVYHRDKWLTIPMKAIMEYLAESVFKN